MGKGLDGVGTTQVAVLTEAFSRSSMNVEADTQLAELAGQPPEIQAEIIRINTEARPIALQMARIAILAGAAGLVAVLPHDAASHPKPAVPKGVRPGLSLAGLRTLPAQTVARDAEAHHPQAQPNEVT